MVRSIAFAVFRLMFRSLKDFVHVDRNASITVRLVCPYALSLKVDSDITSSQT